MPSSFTLKTSPGNAPEERDTPAERLPLVALVGATATGKTDTAIALAERLEAEVVSADSRYFYTGMDIGTAKPSPAERARVPHHLIDVTTPDRPWSLTIFQQAAQRAIAEIHARGRLPLLVGGTGQYVRAVIEGWDAPPQEPDPRLRDALEAWAGQIGPLALHQKLALLDPPAAQTIDYQNVRRTIRALEVIFGSGRRFSAQRRKSGSPYHVLLVGLQRPRPEIYARVDARIDQMLAAGWLDEVRALLRQGYRLDLPGLSAIGYRELAYYLRGRATLPEAVTLIKRQTRVFVRRQAMWFRADDPAIHWVAAGEGAVEQIEGLIRAELGRW